MASDLLNLVANEYRRSVAYAEPINAARQLKLNYLKGVMPDVVAPNKRSRAVSTDLAEAVDSIMPEIMEVFTGSDDVVVFEPVGPEDEDAARQETDYINHVFFKENNGFLVLHSMCKDALVTTTGVGKCVWEEYQESDEDFEGQGLDALGLAIQEYGERVVLSVEAQETIAEFQQLEAAGLPVDPADVLVDYKIKGEKRGRACVESVPPEDFGVSEDTVQLWDSPYHWHRTRIRAYELLRRGIKRKIVNQIPTSAIEDQVNVEVARSVADQAYYDTGGPTFDQRIVEVVEHYVMTEKGRKRILTDAACQIEIECEDHPDVSFASMSPFPIPHQYYGMDMGDKLVEIQRVKTVLTRMLLDSGNFALNQRMAVNMDTAHQYTLSDIMSNEPNKPIRVRGDARAAVSPVVSGGVSYDMQGALEYMSVQGEQRSGVIRNAQGLNPDALHDTARGASIMLSAAQKRTRMICRVFAETGIRDLFLILHRIIRENQTKTAKVRLRNKWVDIDPTSWGSRNDMTVEIGVGAGGREQQAAMYQQGWEALSQLIALQGGPSGPLVTPENIYTFAAQAFERGLGFRSSEAFITNPENAPPQEPKPDPAQQEAEAKMAIEQQKIEAQRMRDEAQVETERMKAAAQIETERMKMEASIAMEREKNENTIQMERERYEMQAQLARDKAVEEALLARQKAELEAEIAAIHAQATISKNRPGGDLDK